MSENIRHNCGWCLTHTLHDAYGFLRSLQHRGREAAGIAAIGHNRIDVVKWAGPVTKFGSDNLHKVFPKSHQYHTFLGHVRYATSGRKDKILEDAHPHTIGGIFENRGNHHIKRDCDSVVVHNGQIYKKHIPISRVGLLKTECDSEQALHYFIEHGEFNFINNVPGAYTLAVAQKNRSEVVLMRDPLGMHPIILGRKDGKFVASSEDMVFGENGGEEIEDLEPGSIYYITPEGDVRKQKGLESKVKAHCMFEFQYILNKKSIIDDVSTTVHRRMLGEQLAKEFFPTDASFVTYAPSCPEGAARRYSKVTGLPFIDAFYKMRNERSFQDSTKEDREKSINENLFLRPGMEETLKDQTLVVIEDSLVRGNVLNRIKHLLYDKAKVKKAYVASYTSPLCIIGEDGKERGCEFGVDMPSTPLGKDSYIARGRTMEQISEKVGMPVYYLSMNGMMQAFEKSGIKKENLCTYCLGGEHPFTRLTVKGE